MAKTSEGNASRCRTPIRFLPSEAKKRLTLLVDDPATQSRARTERTLPTTSRITLHLNGHRRPQ
ncbi:hypothetical protein AG1IA_08753 [Rhizoctonia solani AG-1 IA]|uniref:Uncharacterized protein n=1 Tax=Thanatephorus cucumeris (strain AG1-IA) TaxID=983506 RepID=L8WK80_THACA|nr:hypothetical protein AG1IA_08753 [Rhizoctonia solani AG-1 IA]